MKDYTTDGSMQKNTKKDPTMVAATKEAPMMHQIIRKWQCKVYTVPVNDTEPGDKF